MSERRWEAAGVALVALAALLLFLVYPTYPNYDAYYHLDWGRELLDGVKPSFEAYQAPTEHPLFIAACALLTLLGGDADRVLVGLTLASFVVLLWGTFRLGAALFGRWPGAAAAFFAGSSFAFVLYAVRAYVDVPFLALVVWAAALEVRRPGRGLPVLGLLALAGLLRPEAWLLAGAYWLWRGRRSISGAVLVAVAPLVWAATDLWVTGDPLYSLHSTSDLADELHRNSGIGHLPGAFVSFLAGTVKPPVAVGALAGALLAWRFVDRRRLVVPAALFGAGAVTFVLTGIAGLSILPRYLTVPALALCLFAGYAALGFTELPAQEPVRRTWTRVVAVGAVAAVVFAVFNAPSVGRLRGELRFVGRSHDDLVSILHSRQVQSGLRCGPLTFPNYRLVPDARFILDLPRERVGARSAKRRDRGVAIFVLGRKALRRFGFAQGASPRTNVPDPGFVLAAHNDTFAAYVSCPERA